MLGLPNRRRLRRDASAGELRCVSQSHNTVALRGVALLLPTANTAHAHKSQYQVFVETTTGNCSKRARTVL
jgi:hypothetical protein